MNILCRLRQKFGRHLTKERNHDLLTQHIQTYEIDKTAVQQNIIIIGAGFAGCMAGWLLEKAGHNVTIIEATERIGGRVKSLYNFSQGRVIEEGAEFINGFDSHWISLARHFGLILNGVPTEQQFDLMGLDNILTINGHNISGNKLKEIETEVHTVLMRISKHAAIIQFPTEPWNEPLNIQMYDQISVGQILDNWKVHGLARELLNLTLENDGVSSIYDQSWLGLLCHIRGSTLGFSTQEYWDLLELFRCGNGNVSLAYKLVEHINVIYNQPVKSISYDKGYVLIETSKKQYKADKAILTVSPNVWSKIKFNPQFDEQKYFPHLGPSLKNINICTHPFWIQQKVSPSAINSNIGHIWSPTANQTTYPNQEAVLSIFIGGPYVNKIVQNQSYINKQMNLTFPNFTTYQTNAIFSKHLTDPYIKTGYSYAHVNHYLSLMKNLTIPPPQFFNQLILAGEYTSPTAYGFMEGALISGYHAAKFIFDQPNTY